MGGHSLIATQVMARVRRAFKVELALREIFERPTIAGLGERIREQMRGGDGIKQRLIQRETRAGDIGLSFAQQRLWFLDQLEPNSPVYNLPLVIRTKGELDVAAFESAVNEVIQRHEILRTTFITEDGTPAQVIAPQLQITLSVVDIASDDSFDAEKSKTNNGRSATAF